MPGQASKPAGRTVAQTAAASSLQPERNFSTNRWLLEAQPQPPTERPFAPEPRPVAWQPKLDRPRLLAHRAPWRLSADALHCKLRGLAWGQGWLLDVNGIRAAEQEGRSRPNRDSRPSFAQGKLRGDLGALLGQQDNHHTASKPRAMAPQGDVSSLLAATACSNGLQQRLVLQRIHGSPRRGVASREHNESLAPAGRTLTADGGGQPGKSMSKSSKGISKVRNSSFLRERPCLKQSRTHQRPRRAMR